MSEKTFAVIPTKFKSGNLLYDLIGVLNKDPSIYRIYILDNTGDTPSYRNTTKVRELPYPRYTIYEMWNGIWQYIQKLYPKDILNIAFLNDDIKLPTNGIQALAHNLRIRPELGIIYPDVNGSWDLPYGLVQGIANPFYEVQYTNTTGGAGGMTGFCFVLKAELGIPYIDENLKLYWGDDDLVKQTIAKGYKVGKLVGMPIQHVGGMTTGKMERGEWNRLMEADRRYFNKKYNEYRSPVI